MSKIFDCQRDARIIVSGGFWCEACLVGKPKDDQSRDPRYCQGCFDFLLKEAKLIPPGKGKPAWIPQVADNAPLKPPENLTSGTIAGKTAVTTYRPISSQGSDTVTPDVTEKISLLSGQGLSTRAISDQLREEGIKTNHVKVYRTIKKLQERICVTF